MSKKKKKLKKIKKNNPVASQPLKEAASSAETVELSKENLGIKDTVKEKKVLDDNEDSHDYGYVRKEIKFILFLIALVLILYVAAYYIKSHTSLFQNIGSWIYSTANIQAQ